MTNATRVATSGAVGALVLVGALLAACGAPQKPIEIAGAPPADAKSRVSAALASEGHVPDANASNDNLVVTEWRDTGFNYGFVDQQKATIVRRFLVSISPTSTTVRLDAKRCAVGGYSIEGVDVRGRCEDVADIPAPIQTELDKVGAKLQTALKN
jgi:hypothetical protein